MLAAYAAAGSHIRNRFILNTDCHFSIGDFGGLSIWIYIVLWIVVPRATTVAQKLEMRGIPVTAENIRNYSATI